MLCLFRVHDVIDFEDYSIDSEFHISVGSIRICYSALLIALVDVECL